MMCHGSLPAVDERSLWSLQKIEVAPGCMQQLFNSSLARVYFWQKFSRLRGRKRMSNLPATVCYMARYSRLRSSIVPALCHPNGGIPALFTAVESKEAGFDFPSPGTRSIRPKAIQRRWQQCSRVADAQKIEKTPSMMRPFGIISPEIKKRLLCIEPLV